MRHVASALAVVVVLVGTPAPQAIAQNVFDAVLAETDQKTPDVSTNELRRIIENGSAVLLDARPPLEYAISHIPRALNVGPGAGRPAHLYVSDVAEVGRILKGAKDQPLILYCNGPFCGKSKRLAAELVEAGYANVRRYQLGAPGWRALAGSAMQTELHALSYIRRDPTAVWIDAREPAAFAAGSVSGARNLPASGLKPGKDQGIIKDAKDDGRLPMEDHNTRIVVFGTNGKDAQAVADGIAREAFHNVSFVIEPFEEVRRATGLP
jgi:rhodanese-related sulfurtransferase